MNEVSNSVRTCSLNEKLFVYSLQSKDYVNLARSGNHAAFLEIKSAPKSHVGYLAGLG